MAKQPRDYFKVKLSDITEAMVERSGIADVFEMSRTIDDDFLMISFDKNKVPVELLKMKYMPLSRLDAKEEIESGRWQDATIVTLGLEDGLGCLALEDGFQLLLEG